jgi:hypothetical protein
VPPRRGFQLTVGIVHAATQVCAAVDGRALAVDAKAPVAQEVVVKHDLGGYEGSMGANACEVWLYSKCRTGLRPGCGDIQAFMESNGGAFCCFHIH